MMKRFRLAAGAISAGLVLIAAPVAAFTLNGWDGDRSGESQGVQPGVPSWTPAPSASAKGPLAAAAPDGSGYTAYVALAGASAIAKVDVTVHTVLSAAIRGDQAEGVAVTPDGTKVYVAVTGQYQVKAVDTATLKTTRIVVGAYPEDVAVSPDGSQVYATVTGGDTGPGGSRTVAVISTATDTVTQRIDVGAAPRRVVFAPDGRHAYVTTARGLVVIDTAKAEVSGHITGIPTAQSVAVSRDGTRLYVTQPDADTLWVADTARGRVIGSISAGTEPWAVTVTPDGTKVYVADMNSDSVGVYDPATGRHLADVAVGRLPGSIAVTPDGSEVWAGNIMTGTVSVISTATDTLTTTIKGGTASATLNTAPLGISFVKNP